ncbi:MAG TPA: glycoside hydrolase family 3 N-terminal domain-containing protein, partial [Psychromonas sp.]
MKAKYMMPVLGLTGIALLSGCNSNSDNRVEQADLGTSSATLISDDNYQFKDLDRDGKLTPYEDWRLSDKVRVDDLIGRLSLAEKVGLMMHGTLTLDGNGRVDLSAMDSVLKTNLVNTFITRMGGDPALIATDNNSLQAVAESIGFGIPMSISSDPRNHFVNDPNATSVGAGDFSQWPETLGFAAVNDADLVEEFADIARQEYRAVGIQIALSPQADLATEPRWGRISGTFGEDNLTSKGLVQAYIEGFQHGNNGLVEDSVVTVVKHFAGGGPQKNGLDAHNYFGKEQAYPGDNFAYHLVPFEGAFNAKVASVMPYYGQPEDLTYKGETIESVGFGFNKQVLNDILRGDYGFEGVVLSDWLIVNDCVEECITGLSPEQVAAGVSPWSIIGKMGMSWGVENLSIKDRYAKAVNAGVDQFGGVDDPSYLLAAVNEGLITETRIDQAVSRILLQKFQQGLFENPYVDVAQAVALVGNSDFQAKAQAAQSKSHVLLKNNGDLLPLTDTAKKVYLYNVNSDVAESYGFTVVSDLADAELAILRVSTGYETDPAYPFGSIHFGQLGLDSAESVVQDIDHEGVYTGAD